MKYIEQLFAEFYECAMQNGIPIQQMDKSPCKSFYNLCALHKPLTEKQANFVIRLLKKYQTFAESYGLEYQDELSDPQWEHPFRTIDTSKKVFIEHDEDNMPWVCFKFPYSLIQTFENANLLIGSAKEDFIYDKDRKVRMAPLHNLNVIQIADFASSIGFEIDSVFSEYLSYAEEILNNIDNFEPHANSNGTELQLINSPIDFLLPHIDFDSACFEAKCMGYPVRNLGKDRFSKICSAKTNKFKSETWDTLFEVGERITGCVAIVLSRSSNESELKAILADIMQSAKNVGVNPNAVKACFRKDSKHNEGFNSWLAQNNLTGPVKEGKYFIFDSKPAKWLFKEEIDVSIIATNTVYMHGNALTNNWFQTHPCVLYVTTGEPVKEQKIVNL